VFNFRFNSKSNSTKPLKLGMWSFLWRYTIHISTKSVLNIVEFKVLKDVVIQMSVFWDIMPCSSLKVNRRF
jgi:hypothetical protein